MNFLNCLAFVLFLTNIANGAISLSNCGRRPLAESTKIVNGNVSIVGDWGWQVSFVHDERQRRERHFCGGVLINSQYVLSAAHCFTSNNVNLKHKVYFGLHNRFDKESWVVSRTLDKVFRHENFSRVALGNDIALVKLSSPVLIDDKYIIPACLDETNSFPPEGREGYITGWGDRFYQSGQGTVELNVGTIDIFSTTRCKQLFSTSINTNSAICGGEKDANANACQGDSGGPLVVQNLSDKKWYLQGLISWGYGCGGGTVFTRVAYYIDWINSKIALN